MFDYSIFTNNQRVYQEKLDREVLSNLPESIRKFIPKYFGDEFENVTKIEGELPSENLYFLDSDYFLKPKDFYIHFTSYESAISIVKSGCLRMFNLHNSNDENELVNTAYKFNFSKEHIKVLKSQIFTFSLCEFDNYDDSEFNLQWNRYGGEAEGIGIVFKIINNAEKWKNYLFSNIKYSPALWLNTFSDSVHKWNDKNPFYYAHIPKLFSFHKDKKWSDEKEVRLLYNACFNKADNFPVPSNSIQGNVYVENNWKEIKIPQIKNIKNQNIYFLELPFFKRSLNDIEMNYFDYSPLLQIDAFIIGNRHEAFKNHKKLRGFKVLCNELLGYTPQFIDSKLN